jgi:two-component system copper resistance phosphate regulon response regulator CusR
LAVRGVLRAVAADAALPVELVVASPVRVAPVVARWLAECGVVRAVVVADGAERAWGASGAAALPGGGGAAAGRAVGAAPVVLVRRARGRGVGPLSATVPLRPPLEHVRLPASAVPPSSRHRVAPRAVAMRILVIEDDPTVGQFVKRGLEEQQFTVDLESDGEAGERRAGSGETYDVVVLDMRLPGKDGLAVLRGLRSRGFQRPVLVLTAQDAVDAKVQTLRAGADDYVTKPFAFEELLARIEALARRPRQLATRRLSVADLALDLDSREVARGGVPIELTPKEFKVLEYLMRHPGRVMSRTLITEYAWGYHFDPGTNIVDVVITHLRKKVDHGHERKLIGTVRGVGYVVKE